MPVDLGGKVRLLPFSRSSDAELANLVSENGLGFTPAEARSLTGQAKVKAKPTRHAHGTSRSVLALPQG